MVKNYNTSRDFYTQPANASNSTAEPPSIPSTHRVIQNPWHPNNYWVKASDILPSPPTDGLRHDDNFIKNSIEATFQSVASLQANNNLPKRVYERMQNKTFDKQKIVQNFTKYLNRDRKYGNDAVFRRSETSM